MSLWDEAQQVGHVARPPSSNTSLRVNRNVQSIGYTLAVILAVTAIATGNGDDVDKRLSIGCVVSTISVNAHSNGSVIISSGQSSASPLASSLLLSSMDTTASSLVTHSRAMISISPVPTSVLARLSSVRWPPSLVRT